LKLKQEEKTNLDLLDKTSLFLEDKLENLELEKFKEDFKELQNKFSKTKTEHSSSPMWNETCVQFMYANNKFWRREL